MPFPKYQTIQGKGNVYPLESKLIHARSHLLSILHIYHSLYFPSYHPKETQMMKLSMKFARSHDTINCMLSTMIIVFHRMSFIPMTLHNHHKLHQK